jgi:hypothetical protein
LSCAITSAGRAVPANPNDYGQSRNQLLERGNSCIEETLEVSLKRRLVGWILAQRLLKVLVVKTGDGDLAPGRLEILGSFLGSCVLNGN